MVYACCFIRALQTFASQRISATVSKLHDVKRKYNGNENGYIQIYQFPFQIFLFRFRFCNFFVSVFVSVDEIKIFPLTDISVSDNVNHTVITDGGPGNSRDLALLRQ